MKLYKLMLGLGSVAALTLTSCHDDPTYTPAEKVATPAAYFNMSEEHEVTLDLGDKEFEIPVYRADGNGELTVPVACTITAPEGVNPNVFTVPGSVTFADGETQGKMKVTFNLDDIVPVKDYIFNLKVEGESTPYFLTSVDYVVAYIPWETVTDPATGSDVSTIYNDALLTRPWELSVEVQKHPETEGLYRIYQPYLNTPDIEGTSHLIPASDPNWLYINATNKNAVFFSDAKGKPNTFYHTGWSLFDEESVEKGDQELVLICVYSQYLIQKNLVYPGATVAYGWEQFAGDAGVDENGVISFTDSKICWTTPTRTTNADGYLYSYPVWRLTLASSTPPVEWETLGTGTYTDGFLSSFFEAEFESYTVTVEQNIDNPAKYRIINPYLASGGFPYESPGSDDADYNVEFDCSDANFVLMPSQDFGWFDNKIGYGGCNADAWYYYGYGKDTMSKQEIIAQNLNDKLEAGTIYINHPILIDDKNGYFLWKEDVFYPGRLVLPAGATSKNMVKKYDAKPTLGGGRINLRKYMPKANVQGRFKQAQPKPSQIASGKSHFVR